MSENKLNEIPEVMMAVQLTGNGGPEKLSVLHDIPVPEIGEDEVLLRVKTCGMNNTDVNTRVGWYSKAVTGETTGEALDVSDGDASWGGSGIGFPRIQGA
ncbi:MAG: alcohol dehydrogenase, partial [Acidimicrobiales bacterium]|nr:alcohol dehydrogenase [Acidimicrobiales bacterium]